MDEIWSHGYAAATVKSLSETLGITRSSFYNAFDTREALFARVLQLYGSRSPDAAFQNVTPGTPIIPLIVKVFYAVCVARAEDAEHRGCMVINTVNEVHARDQEVFDMASAAVTASVDRFRQLLAIAREQGEIPGGTNIDTLALALQNTLAGLNTMARVIHDLPSLWEPTRAMLQALGLPCDVNCANENGAA